jgi:hypothetical protein
MSVDRSFFFDHSAGFSSITSLAPNISSERSFFDPPMNTRFFKSFKSRRLCMGQARFGAAFRKGPSPAAARPNQQKLDSLASQPVANRRDLFTFA